MNPARLFVALLLVSFCAGAQVSVQFVGSNVIGISADGSTVIGADSSAWFRYNIATHAQDALSFLPTSISGDGSVVVGIHFGTTFEAKRWSGGTSTTIGAIPPQVFSLFRAANAERLTGMTSSSGFTGFLSDGTSFTPVTAGGGLFEPTGISYDGNRVVGRDAQGAVLIESGLPRYLGAGELTSVSGISGDGLTLIGSDATGLAYQDSTGLHPITLPPGASSNGASLTAVNENGRVIAGEFTSTPDYTPFVWTKPRGAVPLNEIAPEPSGWFFDHITGISADGSVVVGTAFTFDGLQSQGFIISGLDRFVPVPEPATYGAAAGLGLIGLVLARRRAGTRNRAG